MTISILAPALFMVIGALIFAFSTKASQLGAYLFLAGALVLCLVFAHATIHI